MARVTAAEKAAAEARELDLVRALVRNLSDRQVRVLAEAARVQATMLDELDRSYPNPERRGDAEILRELSATVARANVASDFIETGV